LVYRAGTVPYAVAWQWQQKLGELIAEGVIPAVLLLLEHPHTYTIGRRGSAAHIRWTQDELDRRRVTVHWVDRGGDVTYHGPGQVVGYPLLPLQKLGFVSTVQGDVPMVDTIAFVNELEQVLIRTLMRFGASACSREGFRGVWIAPPQGADSAQIQDWRKIASIGIKLTARGVTQHGFALNISPQMEYWEGIIPCGLADCHMTSLAEILDPLPPLEALLDTLLVEFRRAFGLSIVEVNQLPFDTSTESHYTIP